jgi:phosphate transport system substrate-binding protein
MLMTNKKTLGVLTTLVVGAIALAGCGGSSGGSSTAASTGGSAGGGGSGSTSKVLVGAGSSLVYPIMSQWSGDYSKKAGVTVTYGPIGSGGGIEQITNRAVDFGASDAPMTPEQAKAAKGVLQIPWALAGTLVAYNVKGAPSQLKLSGPVVADIYLGKIKTWNDPAIAKLNPGAKLPATAIRPIYRSDSSGDTYAFTDYLSKVSPEWKSKVGASTSVSFPSGQGSKGNSGVGGSLTHTDGGIAYLAISYVFDSHLNYALIQNAAGKFPQPGVSSIAAAAKAGNGFKSDNSISLVDPPASAPDAYPIATYTYALVPQSTPKASTIKPFLLYAIGPGQKFGAKLQFAPLAPQVIARDKQTIAKIGA